MIVDAFLGWISSALAFVVENLPAPQVPEWLSGFSMEAASATASVGYMGNWVPVPLLAAIGTVVAAAWAAGLIMKIGRIVLSFFTAGGGSAA